ncbi:MAG: hypothetical protein WC444_03015 [Candidatus Paceibacterota bacterium]
MKKIILSVLFTTILYSSTPQQVNAIYCSNCKNVVQGWFDAVKETITAFATPITATQQTLATINDNVLIPMRDAMTLISIMQSGDAIQNLIKGSLGTEALLIKNPELYLQNKTLAVVNASLGDIAKQNGVYSNSILGSVIATTKFDAAPLSTKLAILGASGIPAAEQKTRCTDAALSAQAKLDVMSVNPNYTQAQYTARKTELNNALCGSLSDPKTLAAIKAVSAINPSWDNWLATTGGDNAYTKSVLSQQVIDKAAADKVELAKADTAAGGGIKSKTVCTKRTTTDANGVTVTGAAALSLPCIQEEIQQAASVLNNSFKGAIDGPTKVALAGFGKGAGSLISTAFTTIGLINGIMSPLSGGGSGGGASTAQATVGGQTTTVTAVTPNNTTTTSTTVPVKDLTNNPTAKTTLTKPTKDQLAMHAESLATLETTDQSFISSVQVFQGQIDTVKACYDKLVADYPQSQASATQASFTNYYTGKKASNDALIVKLRAEISLIGTTKTLVTNTQNKIEASLSSEEILNTFNAYQNQVDSQKLPSLTSGISREGDYQTYKGEAETASLEGGALTTYQADCASTRQRLEMW